MAINMGTATAYLELDTSKFTKGFKSAYNDLKVFRDQTATVEQKMNGLSSAMVTVGSVMGKNVTLPILGVGAASLKASTDFEAGMSQVKAISGATQEEFEDLKDKAIEMGAKTKFSASESADAFKYMAMAGWDAQSMMSGISGIMDLAAASGEDLATTSDIVTDALTAFGLQAKDSAHFADVLAQASSKSNTNVGLMGETFKYVAPVAGALGYSVEDTAIAIGLMANNGIKGSQAGTALRAVMTRLAKPTDQVAVAMEQYNISLSNADGTMKPLRQTLTEMRDRFRGLNEEQKASLAATLAGQEGMSGLLAIMNSSESDFENLKYNIDNSTGAAKDMAETMMDNTKGAIEQLKGALESAGIVIGDKLTPYIRKAAEWITKMVDNFNDLTEEQQKNIVKWVMLVAGISPFLTVGGRTLKLVTKMSSSFIKGANDIKNFSKTLVLAKAGLSDTAENMNGLYRILTSLNPTVIIGAGAFIALSAAVVNNIKHFNDIREESAKLTEQEKILSDAIEEQTEKRKIMEQLRTDAIKSSNEEGVMMNTLAEKLRSVTDENGRVIEGKETYAKFLVGELSSAMGKEIEMIDGQIQNYDSLMGSIQETIEKKKALAMQEAIGEQYKEALKNQMDAQVQYNDKLQETIDLEVEYAKKQEEVLEASRQMAEARQKGGDAYLGVKKNVRELNAELKGLEDKMKKSNKQLNDAEKSMISYNEVVKNYEGLSSALIENDADKINEALLKIQEGFLTSEIATRDSLEKQAETIQEKYETMKKALEEGAVGVTEESVEQIRNLSEQAQKELDAKLEQDKELLKQKFSEVGIEAPQELINSLMQKEPEEVAVLTSMFDKLKSGTQLKKEEIKILFDNLGIEAPQNLISSLSNLEPSVQASAINLLQQLQNAESSKRPEIEKQLNDLGIQMDNSLSSGIKSNEGKVTSQADSTSKKAHDTMQKNVEQDLKAPKLKEITNASTIAWDARNSMQSIFDQNPLSVVANVIKKGLGIDGSHANGLDYVPYNGYIAELHEGERVLTKQQNRDYNRGRTGQGGDTFNFYNTKPTPYEYARQMKKAKRELLYDF